MRSLLGTHGLLQHQRTVCCWISVAFIVTTVSPAQATIGCYTIDTVIGYYTIDTVIGYYTIDTVIGYYTTDTVIGYYTIDIY